MAIIFFGISLAGCFRFVKATLLRWLNGQPGKKIIPRNFFDSQHN